MSMEKQELPRHIGIIMDGNGRWAKRRGLPRIAGHKVGADVFRKIARYCNKLGIQTLTVYAFSTENWKRPDKEVAAIMDLLREYLRDSKSYVKENIQLQFIGDRARLDADIVAQMAQSERLSANATGLHVNLAVNYGGRDELVRAVQRLCEQAASGAIKPEQVDEALISDMLDTTGQIDPDLILRTGGEMRLSNFLTWQSAYAEYISTPTLWPDMKEKDIDKALEEYASRSRRFGGI